MFQGRVGQRHLPVSRSQYPSQWHTHISSILKDLCPDARLVSHFLLHKETCTKDTYCLEKKRDKKKGRAPRWATFRWGLALKSSRTTENEASLTRCPCCQRVLMHKEGHLHTSIIFHDISRLKIIRIRSFASNLNLTWLGENSWKHSFTFGTLGTHLRSPLNGDMQLIRPQPWTKTYERVCLR